MHHIGADAQRDHNCCEPAYTHTDLVSCTQKSGVWGKTKIAVFGLFFAQN
jgi:hypothetical protein